MQAVASMGWVAGMLCLLAFYVIQMGASYMLASLYEVDGKKRGRYQDVVAAFLGERPAAQRAAMITAARGDPLCGSARPVAEPEVPPAPQPCRQPFRRPPALLQARAASWP